MGQTGAELFIETLEDYGVTHLFGNPGTTELPVMNAVAGSDLDYILALHEDIAVGMAAGYARTRQWHANRTDGINPVGVVNLHVTPGLAHGLGNLYDASYFGTGAPIVVTAGAHGIEHQHREPILHGELVEMAEQFCKWSAEIKHIDAMPNMLRRAFRIARTPPTGPVFLSLPFDVMTGETDAQPDRMGTIPDAGAGDQTQIHDAAERIVDASAPVLVVGDGVGRIGAPAVEAAVELAEASGARVVSEFKAKEVNFPSDHDQWVGSLPDDQETATALLDGDVICFVGVISNVPTLPEDIPTLPPEATCIHVTDNDWELGKNQRADLGILGDPGTVMAQLAETVGDRLDQQERSRRLDEATEYADQYGPDGSTDMDGPSGIASKTQLAEAVVTAAPTARVVAESSTSDGYLQPLLGPEQFIRQRAGGLGFGLPAAVGAALAEAERSDPRDVIGYVGDGAFLYYPHTLYTAARYDIDFTVIVCDNRNYRILKDNMIGIFGGADEDYDFVGMDFDPPFDIPGNVETQGARGRRIEEPDAIVPAIETAIDEAGPSVLDVRIHD
ncbi:MAG: thiamine pyrophosphate-binding protein [Halobacteriales archaeon]|nr:thiamine pyrophosphate-binding protein [Halobacteriales archaeon]